MSNSLTKNKIFKLLNFVAFFNFSLLFVDIVLGFIASKEVKALYFETGIPVIYDIGVYNFMILSLTALFGTVAFLFNFHVVEKSKNIIYEVILITLLIFSTFLLLRIFFETMNILI